MKSWILKSSFVVLSLATALACSSTAEPPKPTGFPSELAKRGIENYKANTLREYQAVLAAAKKVQTAVDAFVAAPTEATHKAAKDAWIEARVIYGPSEAHRFYGGPIDDEKTGPEGQINAWPLDESTIDYTRETPDSGIVNDTSKTITKEFLAEQNEKGGDTAITTGWHAIEFLLWGQDDTEPGKGAGKRAVADFQDGSNAKNQARRRAYLKAATDLLVDDLESLVKAWTPSEPDSFAKRFGVTAADPTVEADPTKEAVGSLLRAMGSMAKAELSGERMTVAFKNRSEEDEHSCFSDTTATDILGNGLGLENLWLGRYASSDGVGLDEVVRAVNPTLAEKTTQDMATMVAKLQALKTLQDNGSPIDVLLQAPDSDAGRVKMLEAIKALKVIGEDVEAAVKALGLKVTLESPSEEL
jgi:putative iron-regulated protein